MENTTRNIFTPNQNIKNSKRNKFFKQIEAMFNYESKLSKLLKPQFIQNYKETYFYVLDKIEKGELPSMENYLGDNLLAKNIYQNKYFLKDLNGENIEQRAEDVFLRVASYIGSVEKNIENSLKYAEKIYLDLFDGNYLPGGRVLAGSGDLFRLKTLANCFVSIIDEDNLESIYKTAYEAARTYSYGGGMGIDLSQLRPKDSRVHNAANTSTGAVSFMDLYSLTTGLIGQSGRRGALMLSVDIKHPDIMDFISVKKNSNWSTNQIMDRLSMSKLYSEEQLEIAKKNIIENTQVRFANISIKVSDEFMNCVEEQNKFGSNHILVYAKAKGGKIIGKSSDEFNYSFGVSDKKLENYSLLKNLNSIEELNNFLTEKGICQISKNQLEDEKSRDFYGDFIIESENLDFDLAIRYSGDFLTYYESKSVGKISKLHKARDIWNAFIEGNYKTAEPGLIFWSQMTKYSPSNYLGSPIVCTNPCGEVPLEDGGSCNLGSINLSRIIDDGFTNDARINWAKLAESVTTLTRFLDNVVTLNGTLNALEKQRSTSINLRRLGIGIMGIADLFNQLGLEFDSEEALSILENIMNFITQTAYQASALLAKEKGQSPIFNYESYSKNPFFKEILNEDNKDLIKNYGLRNNALIAIAPTGTISNAICGFRTKNKNYIGVSGGIEPVFALYYSRRSEQMNQGVTYKVFHSVVQAYIDKNNLGETLNSANPEELKKILPKHFFKTAHTISHDMRIKIQSIAQKYVDHSISSTVNLAEDISPETISQIYLNAWKSGLKGITIYRDGSRYPILSVEGKESDFQRFEKKKFKMTIEGKEKIVSGTQVLVTPSGKLTTIYHGKSEGLF